MGIKIFDLITLLQNKTGQEVRFHVRDPTSLGLGISYGACPVPDLARGQTRSVKLNRILRKRENYRWTISVDVNGSYTGIEIQPWDIITHVLIVFRYQQGNDQEILCVEGVRENRSTDFFFRHRGFGFGRKKWWSRRSKQTIARADSHMATKLRNAEATITEQAESAATMPLLQGDVIDMEIKKKKNNNLSYIADRDNTSPPTSTSSKMSSIGTSGQATKLSDEDTESPVSPHLQDTTAATPLVPGDAQDIEVPVKNSISTATTFPLQSGQDMEDPEESQPHQGTLTNASPLLRQLRVDRGHTHMQIATGNEGRKILKKPRKIKRTTSEETSLLPNIGESKHQTSFTHGYQIHPGHRYSNVKALSSAVSIVTGAKSENFRKKLMLIIRSRVQRSRDGDDQVPYPLPNDPTFMDGFVYGVLFSFVLVFVSYFYISWV